MKKKVKEEVRNGLADIIMGGINPMASGTQVNQTDSFFNNVRTYLISNMRQILSQSYVEHGIVQCLIDVPVDDAFRGGVDIKSKQLSSEDIEALQATLEHEGILLTLAQTMKWVRLYGGGAVVIMTNQEHDKPLDLKNLKDMEFRAVDMWELFSTQQNIDDDTRTLEIKKDKNFCYNYYAINLHNSRAIPIKGIVAPSFIRPRLRGWGFSVVERLVSSINQFFKAKNLTFEVLDEFKLDIFKIKGFNMTLSQKDGAAKIVQRTTLANQQKNFQNALTMDVEDDHISKQLNFSGIAEVKKEIRIEIASDLRMPMTKLFGLSAAGFSSGEDEIEVYNSMVESDVRFKAKKPLLEMIKLICMRDFGIIPTDLDIEFKNLRIMSAESEESVKNSKMSRLAQALAAGVISEQEFRTSCNNGNLFDVKLDVEDTEREAISE